MKTTYLIFAASIVLSGLIFTILSPSKNAYVTNEAILSVPTENIPKGINFIVTPHMREALNDTERDTLTKNFLHTISHTSIIRTQAKVINSSRTISSKVRLRMNQFEYLLDDFGKVSQEVSHEIGPPAESVDEKLFTTIGQILVITELTSIIKTGLADTSLKNQAADFHSESLAFLKEMNDFKNNFLEAILLDQTKEENQVIVKAFLQNNTQQYSEYDSSRLFNIILQTQSQLHQQFSIK